MTKRPLNRITEWLGAIGVDSPEAEALLILEELTQIPRRNLHEVETLTGEAEIRLEDILSRRRQHEPLQYILGSAPFMDLELQVTPSVLIPRPETEILVELLIKLLPVNGSLLDVGTGSGAIALAVAHARPDVQVTALDVSSAALEVARANRDRYKLHQVRFLESDLLSSLAPDQFFDQIAANLPYVSFAEYAECAPEVRDYEPQLALTAPDDGLALIERCAQTAQKHLNTAGAIHFEIGHTQGPRLKALLQNLAYHNVTIRKDYNHFDRFVSAAK